MIWANNKLSASWKAQLEDQFKCDYMQQLAHYLALQQQAGKSIYPAGDVLFRAFELTPFEQVKIVILGQDPYHGLGQAHGLSFSVPVGIAVPPSLKNIYKELHADLGFEIPAHGYLASWAQQGVLLLNSVLTVEQGEAGAHRGQGWEQFTDQVITKLNQQREGVVFLLWGAYAQKKGAFIDQDKHCVLTAPHPSPLSAHRGFLGCQHFSKANQYLQQQGQAPVNWQLPLAL